MEKNNINDLEETCILEGVGNGKPNSDSEPCLSCIKDCYRPSNMGSEKEEVYINGCKSISYGPEYRGN